MLPLDIDTELSGIYKNVHANGDDRREDGADDDDDDDHNGHWA